MKNDGSLVLNSWNVFIHSNCRGMKRWPPNIYIPFFFSKYFTLCIDDWCLTGSIDVTTIRIVVFASLFGVAIVCVVAVCAFLLYRRLTSTNGASKWTPATTARIKIRYFIFYFFILANCSTQPPQLDTENENKNLKKKGEEFESVKEKTKFSHVDFEFVSRVKFQPATDVSNFTRRPFPNNNNNNNSQNKRWASTFYYKTPIECNKRHKKKHAPPHSRRQ